RTTKRSPSPRCASAIQMVRPSESTAETQHQLHPVLRIVDHLRRRSATADSSYGEFASFKSATGRTRCGELSAHLLDLGGLLLKLGCECVCLLFELGCESLYLFLLLRDRGF